jgi:hypothetical protein
MTRIGNKTMTLGICDLCITHYNSDKLNKKLN